MATNQVSEEQHDDELSETIFKSMESCRVDIDVGFQLSQDILSVEKGIRMFLNSEFLESETLFEHRSQNSLYHSLGHSTILFLKAVVTLQSSDIEAAQSSAEKTLKLANELRKKTSFFQNLTSAIGVIPDPKFEEMSEVQRHAELIFAEIYIIKALINIISDGTGLIQMVKEGLNIRHSHGIYKHAAKYLTDSKRNQVGVSDDHFASGVCLGIGLFNLMVSLLPPRMIRLSEIIGISGDQVKAIEFLKRGSNLNGLRTEFCKMVYLFYHLVLESLIDLPTGNCIEAYEILEDRCRVFPNGVFYKLIKGRYLLCQRNIEYAQELFRETTQIHEKYSHLSHVSHWDLALTHIFLGNHELALDSIKHLQNVSKWSKCFYAYLEAILLLELGEQNLEAKFQNVISQKRRIAGKSIPLEKFVIRKTRLYLKQRRLLFPTLELMLVFGGFRSCSAKLLDHYETQLTMELKRLEDPTLDRKQSNFWNDFALVQLLLGVVKGEQTKPDALSHFDSLASISKRIELDHWYTPIGHLEHARILFRDGQHKSAKSTLALGIACKGYSLENMISMRLHNCNKR